EKLARLEEVVRSAQITNTSFFQSLELVQKNLEALIARAEGAEQRLRALMLQSGAEKKDPYRAAALLLSEGQPPQRVASMLNLPLPQVQIVSQLQKAAQEKKAVARRKRAEEKREGEVGSPSKIAAEREKIAAEPIRLIDVIRKAAAEAATSGGETSPFRGISV
ncbi:MAG TPA: hypothetical protein VNN13_06710, partial [Methylomirabilota bacterium]|nr:hypothetical protein [Methylomirabilota bacterium]